MAEPYPLTVARLLGWRIVRTETLPAGYGVFDDEVGEPGPWYGVDVHGRIFGWQRSSPPLDVLYMLIDELDPRYVIQQIAKSYVEEAEVNYSLWDFDEEAN